MTGRVDLGRFAASWLRAGRMDLDATVRRSSKIYRNRATGAVMAGGALPVVFGPLASRLFRQSGQCILSYSHLLPPSLGCCGDVTTAANGPHFLHGSPAEIARDADHKQAYIRICLLPHTSISAVQSHARRRNFWPCRGRCRFILGFPQGSPRDSRHSGFRYRHVRHPLWAARRLERCGHVRHDAGAGDGVAAGEADRGRPRSCSGRRSR